MQACIVVCSLLLSILLLFSPENVESLTVDGMKNDNPTKQFMKQQQRQQQYQQQQQQQQQKEEQEQQKCPASIPIGRRSAMLNTGATWIWSCLATRTMFPSAATAATSSLSPSSLLSSPSSSSLALRLESEILTMPATTQFSTLPNGTNGVDNLYYPSFLAGEWSVTQTLVGFSTPLGMKYIGGPNGSESIAKSTLEDIKKELNRSVQLSLRYLPTKWGVAEDRIFNTRERLDAFAGKSVVASVAYADVNASNRKSILSLGGSENDPLQTTYTRFKGPAAQKTFVISHGGEYLPTTTNNNDSTISAKEKWVGYECDRSIFALTNQNTAPPVTTDIEYIWMFEKIADDTVRGQLRIASYLNSQSDILYFDARNRAVSLMDYTLQMKKNN